LVNYEHRGEDRREFCRLQRDLIAIFHPYDATILVAVTVLSCAWCKKGHF
jgi:hypothetical protein